MKAYVLKKTGKPGTLRMQDVPEVFPNSNEVKVKVAAIGINYAELLSRRGQYSWAPPKPYIPGMEAYGEVVEIGSEVRRVKVGDKVIIGKQYGNYAEYSCAPEHLCFPAIPGFSPGENAAYLINFMTAWVALKKLCRVVEGDSVLVQAAAGGVGTAAVQIASQLGCKVYGTASKQDKLRLIEELGAHKAINYATESFYDVIKNEIGGIDCVLEVVGGQVFKDSVRLLNPFGRIAVIGFASMNLQWWNPLSWWKTWDAAPKARLMAMAKKSQVIAASHIGYLTENEEETRAGWDELKNFIEEKKLKPIVGKTFAFDKLAEAHTWIESRSSTGKVVVTVDH